MDPPKNQKTLSNTQTPILSDHHRPARPQMCYAMVFLKMARAKKKPKQHQKTTSPGPDFPKGFQQQKRSDPKTPKRN